MFMIFVIDSISETLCILPEESFTFEEQPIVKSIFSFI